MESERTSSSPATSRRLSFAKNSHHSHERRYSHNEDIEIIKNNHAPKTAPSVWKKKMLTWFNRWDADQDGKLTRKDFEILADRMEERYPLSHHKDRIRRLFLYLWEHFVSPGAPSHVGVVTQDEWIESHFKARLEWDKNPTIGASLIATFGFLFDAIDSTGTGSLSKDEYRAFYSIMGLPPTLADEAFQKMDRNADGRLSRDEFLDTVMAYYCELEPTEHELSHSLFLGPLVDTSDLNPDMLMHWAFP